MFVDVGANVGAHSLIASRIVGNAGHVYSFEPHPRTFRYLRGNLRLNRTRNITAVNCAVGAIPKNAFFTNKRSDDQNKVSGKGTAVLVRPLDSLIPPGRVRMIKIDTEGFELFALQGGAEVLRRTDRIYIECFDGHFEEHGYSTRDVLAFLRDHGFQPLLTQDFNPAVCTNVLAVRANPE